MNSNEVLNNVIKDILDERARQINKSFIPEHDNMLTEGQLAEAAAVYASTRFDSKTWYPQGWACTQAHRRKQLINAAALIIAKIERLDRAN